MVMDVRDFSAKHFLCAIEILYPITVTSFYFSLPEKILMRCSSVSLQISKVPSSSATI